VSDTWNLPQIISPTSSGKATNTENGQLKELGKDTLKILKMDCEDSGNIAWAAILGNQVRYNIIRTVISFIGNIYCIRLHKDTELQEFGLTLQSWLFYKSKSAEDYEIKGSRFMRDFNITDDILDCEVRVFFPEIFQEMFVYSNDVHPAHILRSFADELTTEIIEKMRAREGIEDSMGGKSGELIISSLNRKFIIKTISKQEGQTF
jgi:hypothetical protein